MSETQAPASAATAIRAALASQYHAALATLRQAVERCPESLWDSSLHRNRCWQLAYHTLFFAHLYSEVEEATFVPWSGHQSQVQCPDCLPGPPDPNSKLPLIPPPYSQREILDYCAFCDQRIDAALARMDVLAPESGFSWYPIPKLEHQIVNIRHIQHGAAQLADRIRQSIDVGVDWFGKAPRR